jgi:DNA-directed RNA polymerase specialized sigma24 family protein
MIETSQPLQLQRDTCEQIVSDHYDRLYRWFYWLTNAADDAADLTHDTFVAVWQSVDRFDDRRPSKPWLLASVATSGAKHCAGRLARESTRRNRAAEEHDTGPSPAQAC